MAYTVLARRYRSQDFDEVIGQDPIARTLRRAIETDRVAHAYLFCGTRGIGKTSMARIFAKALNVTNDLEDRDAIASAIMRGDDIDVIEIDGASNRGVEEARELIARSLYRPARCPFKIYIIDEVHMLTPESFNTLLKTMEEPPAHVKFILCTTEPHKVPATIQSRCQRFDFRDIPMSLIAEHLADVLKRENMEADEAVVLQVARIANGSMRDGLSLLDRLLASGEAKLTVELMERMLGLPEQTLIDQLLGAIAESEVAAALERVNELTSRGNSLDQMIEVLIERLRSIMIVSVCGAESKDAIELPQEDVEILRNHAKHFDLPAIVHMIVLLENVRRMVKQSSTGRALFEAAVVRLALAEKFADVTALLERGGGTDTAKARTAASGSPSAKKQKKKPVRQGTVVESKEVPAPESSASAANLSVAKPPAAEKATVNVPPTGAPTNAIHLTDHELWSRLQGIAKDNRALDAMLDHLTLASFSGGRAAIVLNDSSLIVQTRNNIPWLEKLMSQECGAAVHIELTLCKEETHGSARAHRSSADASRLTQKDREEAKRIPLVRRAMEILGMRLLQIEDAEASGGGSAKNCSVERTAPSATNE